METFFNIRFEFDKKRVSELIDNRLSILGGDYICVADGNILSMVHASEEYKNIINNSLFSICDSSYVPIYLRWIYGINRDQYSGSDIFYNIIKDRKYRMIFLGTKQSTLDCLQKELSKINPDVKKMTFQELPFKDVNDFDYPSIAEMIKKDKADIIWVALGAPKQEYFMAKLKPYLDYGVMIAVGAAFNFFSGQNVKRAPEWMIKNHLEFCYRIYSEPKKQLKRCWRILSSLPSIFFSECKVKRAVAILPPKKL